MTSLMPGVDEETELLALSVLVMGVVSISGFSIDATHWGVSALMVIIFESVIIGLFGDGAP